MKSIALPFLLNLILISICYGSTGYFRYPSVSERHIVFTSEGDLWILKKGEADAHRLTTGPQAEIKAIFSKDGKWVTFSSDFEGQRALYVIPTEGGNTKRITYEDKYSIPVGWTYSGKIIYNTPNDIGPNSSSILKIVDPISLETETIPLMDVTEGDLDDKSKFLYFTQFGKQTVGDNLKKYRGGLRGTLWKYKLGSKSEAERLLPNHQGSIREPQLDGSTLYFISDESGNDNIWSISTDGSQLKQITHHSDWSVRNMSVYKKQIIYQLGADLRQLNVDTQKDDILSIELLSDFPYQRSRWLKEPLEFASSINLSPKNEHVVISSRSNVLIAKSKARNIEVALPADSRVRNAILSHDEKWIYAFSDINGSNEIWKFATDDSGLKEQITQNGISFKQNMSLSPDGKKIVYSDYRGNLWLTNIDQKSERSLSFKNNWKPHNYRPAVWASDSNHFVFAASALNDTRKQLLLYSIKDDKNEILTSQKYDSHSPAFSSDGKWLYFFSDRNFKAAPGYPWGDRNTGSVFSNRTQLYAISLNEDLKFPFDTENELDKKPEKKEKKRKNNVKKKEKKEAENLKINWDRIQERLYLAPLPSGNYYNLKINKEFIYFLSQPVFGEKQLDLMSYKIEPKSKPLTFLSKVGGFEMTYDGKKLFIATEGKKPKLYLVNAEATFPKKYHDAEINVSDWKLFISPKQEWRQMFYDAWTMHRDFFFDSKMRGIDWEAVKKKFEPLIDRITDRYELDDILKQMVSELNTLHSQVGYGEYPTNSEVPQPATLGAIYKQLKDTVEISYIFTYEKELPELAPPLSRIDVQAQVGDIIVSINQNKVKNIQDIYYALMNQANKQVLIEFKRGNKTFKKVVMPSIGNDFFQLRYNDWTQKNEKVVTTYNKGYGYLHLEAMGGDNFSTFTRDFYGNIHKKGLIIDVRRNYGGNIDSMIIEKLLRKVWSFWKDPAGEDGTNMQQTFRGHLVVLIDQKTYSDGEAFAAGIKALNIAPLIGKQTAGAGVWLSDFNQLADFGRARVAQNSVHALDGRWIIEGRGVSPDIEVDNLPYEFYSKIDNQLNEALKYLDRKLKESPIPTLKAQPIKAVNQPADDIQ